MGLSRVERTTAFFSRWERQGRGWGACSYPVDLEPPFVPFDSFGQYSQENYTDDGRTPSPMALFFQKLFSPALEVALDVDDNEEDEGVLSALIPDVYASSGEVVEFQVLLPDDFSMRPSVMERLLLSLSYLRYPISFELTAAGSRISLHLACRDHDCAHIEQQVSAFLPTAVITRQFGFLADLWQEATPETCSVVDFGLSELFMMPLCKGNNFELDPLIGIIGALANLSDDERVCLQILFKRVANPWENEILRSVTTHDGKSFFIDAPEVVPLTKEKIAKPLFAVAVRIAGLSNTNEKAFSLARAVGRALIASVSGYKNTLIPLSNEGYADDVQIASFINRQTHRTGMLLNVTELVELVHFPNKTVQEPRLLRLSQHTKRAPEITEGNELVLGKNAHQGTVHDVTQSDDQRLKHCHVIGATGTGKSTLLLSLIMQDIHHGKGVGVLDPHGDLIDEICARLPASRRDDVILFDPSDEEYPIGFNILHAHGETEKALISSDLVAVFRRLSTSWGDQMNSIFANAIVAILEHPSGGTLLDLRHFLVDKAFRSQFLEAVDDPEIQFYWRKEYSLIASRNPHTPILTRLDSFLRPKLIRHMVAQKDSKLDFQEVLNTRKIFLAKLTHGAIGEENAHLLGAFLVSKFYQSALARQGIRAPLRHPFFLYIDEFQNFRTPSMQSLLSGARKFGLGLILAHQELGQLGGGEFASSVLSNPYTRIAFRVGDADAKALANGFSFFGAHDLQDLGVGEAIVRVERSSYDFNMLTDTLPSIDHRRPNDMIESLRESSRERYGVPVDAVENLVRSYHTTSEQPSRPQVVEKTVEEVPTPVQKARSESTRAQKTRSSAELPRSYDNSQHTYLQKILCRYAQERGYAATVEAPLSGGGRVDISLKKGEQTIACEISVTTSPEHELGNITKCLEANYDQVILLAHEKRHLGKIERHVKENLSTSDFEKVLFLMPGELIEYLDSNQGKEEQQTVRGYKVKVRYSTLSEDENKERRQAIAKVMLQSMRRMRK